MQLRIRLGRTMLISFRDYEIFVRRVSLLIISMNPYINLSLLINSMFHCFNVSLFIVSIFHCFNVSLSQYFIVSMFHCFNVSLFQCLNVSKTKGAGSGKFISRMSCMNLGSFLISSGSHITLNHANQAISFSMFQDAKDLS